MYIRVNTTRPTSICNTKFHISTCSPLLLACWLALNILATQICYFFYKNIAFGLTLFYFEAFTGFSGQSVYDDWYMLLFNVVLTSLPVIALGVFEQDVSSEICLQVSRLEFHYHAQCRCHPFFFLPLKLNLVLILWTIINHCSFQHYISKDLETCSLTGIESLGGWGTVSTAH